MRTRIKILLACLLGSVFLSQVNAGPENETKYLAFQIFTYGPNPIVATMGEGKNPQPARFPDKTVLRDYIGDIKRRIGTVGEAQTRLAVVLGHLAFDHDDAETTRFIELGFELALKTDVAVGFHIDDSMFWARRQDLWSDPQNVFAWGIGGEAMKGKIGFRVVTEGEEALQAYRKFLLGEPLVEGATVASLTDRLPPKIHKIQAELPAWMQKTRHTETAALMQKMQEQLKAKNLEEVEKTADAILKLLEQFKQDAK